MKTWRDLFIRIKTSIHEDFKMVVSYCDGYKYRNEETEVTKSELIKVISDHRKRIEVADNLDKSIFFICHEEDVALYCDVQELGF